MGLIRASIYHDNRETDFRAIVVVLDYLNAYMDRPGCCHGSVYRGGCDGGVPEGLEKYMSVNNQTGGMGCLSVLLIVFVVLKLAGLIAWSWWWVLAPFWIPLLVALIGLGLFAAWAAKPENH